MSGLVSKKDGIFNNAQRFAVTNILEEDFTSQWGGNPFTIAKGKTVSLPMYLANKVVDEMVDKIMITAIKTNETEYYKNNPNTAPNLYRAPSSLGVPAARKIWEDKIVKPLAIEEGTTESQLLRMQIKEELENDMNKEISRDPVPVPMSAVGSFSSDSMKEFAELGKEEEPKPKKAIKIKEVK